MSSEREFMNRIRADLDNPVPRLVFADWLDEQGDPRGEFIRIQCELEQPHLTRGRARLLRIREKELLKEHRTDWLRPLANHPATNARWTFRRGFVEEVAIDTRDFLNLRHVLGDIFPLLHKLELRGLTRELVEMVANSSVLEQLSYLSLPFHRGHIPEPEYEGPREVLFPEFILELFGSPHLLNLVSLNLTRSDLRPIGLYSLLTLDQVHLRSLNLGEYPFGTDMEAIQLLSGSSTMKNLQELSLAWANLKIQQLLMLTYSDYLKNLESLDLRGNRLCSERNMISLSALKRFPKLKRLDLRGCGVGNVGVETLVKSPLWSQFESLQLARNNIPDRGLIAMASGKTPGNLATLDLQHNAIGNAGLIALAKSPVLSAIPHLHLEHNQIGTAGVIQLARTKFGDRLRGVHLRGNHGIGEPAGIALTNATFPNLETLDLGGTQVGDETSLALVESEMALHLRTLDLTGTQVRETGAMALAGSDSLKNLEILDLRMNHLEANSVTALKERFGRRVLV